jgi:hypothetical protein
MREANRYQDAVLWIEAIVDIGQRILSHYGLKSDV